MTTRDWQMTPQDVRFTTVLEYLYDSEEAFPRIAPAYDNDNDRAQEAYSTIEALDDMGFVNSSPSMGGLDAISAQITPAGRQQVERARQLRGADRLRKDACRTSLIMWLERIGATGSLAKRAATERFFLDDWSLFYGQAFSVDDVNEALAWLKRQQLIDGGSSWQSGVTTPFLTDAGVACAEEFDGDTRAFLAAQKKPAVTQTTNIQAQNLQYAAGDGAIQTMNVGAALADVLAAAHALVELVKSAADSADASELDELEDEANIELKAAQPKNRALLALMRRIKEQAGKVADEKLALAIGLGADSLTREVGHLLGQLT